uniref:NAD(P)-binding domain-containing protein n=1 Tax=Oryza rufipogon TaxID=4529 RepID=A0A0E0Q0X7_ORYRU
MAEESGRRSGGGVRVCVTGGAGFIGSWLVKKLLGAGYTVHATLRSIGDEVKVGLLRRLVPGDAPPERLRLFEADLYDAATFAPAIAGCHTVKRVIYTSSMAATSPLKEDSTGFKDSIDESCWTPLTELLGHSHAGERRRPAVEVVTVPCSVVAGGTLQGQSTTSLDCVVSPVSRDEGRFRALRLLQRLMGSVPMVHVDDVCDALVFCMEQPSLTGRFLCSAAYPTLDDIVEHFAGKYKYGMEEILDGSVGCAARLGYIDAAKLRPQEG